MRHLKFLVLSAVFVFAQSSLADTMDVTDLPPGSLSQLTLINRKTAEELKIECVDAACTSVRLQGFRDIPESSTPGIVTLPTELFAKRIEQCRQELGHRTVISETNDALLESFTKAYFGNHKAPGDVMVLALLYPVVAVIVVGPVIVVTSTLLAPEAGVQALTRPIQYRNAASIVLQVDEDSGTESKKLRKNRYKRVERLLRCTVDGRIDRYAQITPILK